MGTEAPGGGSGVPQMMEQRQLERQEHKGTLKHQGGSHTTNGMNSWDRRTLRGPSENKDRTEECSRSMKDQE